jgi:hypothetical protein
MDCPDINMMISYSTEDQFCYGMTWQEWRRSGGEGKCPYHAKTLRNFNRAEAYDIAKRKNLHAFFCKLSGKWHLAAGKFDATDFEVCDG